MVLKTEPNPFRFAQKDPTSQIKGNIFDLLLIKQSLFYVLFSSLVYQSIIPTSNRLYGLIFTRTFVLCMFFCYAIKISKISRIAGNKTETKPHRAYQPFGIYVNMHKKDWRWCTTGRMKKGTNKKEGLGIRVNI